MMAEVCQSLGQMAGVDALAADVGLAAIGEVCNAQWSVGVERPLHNSFTLPVGNQPQSGETSAKGIALEQSPLDRCL